MSEVRHSIPASHLGTRWEPVKSPLEIIVDTIVVDHTARITDLEKQVAELRALLAERGK
jgi:hypothetical protein